MPAERVDDRLLDRPAVLEEQRSERGLQQRCEDVAVAGEPIELLRNDPVTPPVDEAGAEPELARDDGAARARHDVRADLRQPALLKIGKALVQRTCDRELQNAVPEKLQPLVGGRPVGSPRRVRECVSPARRQLVDQPRKTAGLGVLSLATGAT